ncbi:hypothetical protein MMC19_002517 [Ptychographa xylographoides]|nr:hypothetical protein [Ptychographa xylographoides]
MLLSSYLNPETESTSMPSSTPSGNCPYLDFMPARILSGRRLPDTSPAQLIDVPVKDMPLFPIPLGNNITGRSTYGDQCQHGSSHDSNYPPTKYHPGDTFAAVQDDSSTTFSTAGACGQDSYSFETDSDPWLDFPDFSAPEPTDAELLDRNTALPIQKSFQLNHNDHQISIKEGATIFNWNNPAQPDHTIDPALLSCDGNIYLAEQQQDGELDLKPPGKGRFPAGHFATQGRRRETNVEGKYACSQCTETYKAQPSLRRHEREIHEQSRKDA